MEKRIMNPHPSTHPHLRRAFEEGVLAARRLVKRPREYSCETEEENLAWLDGFMSARFEAARAGEK